MLTSEVCNKYPFMSNMWWETLQPCKSANFAYFLFIFQILTQEDWNTVLYNGMNRTSQWAALYFIALMTFGNYVLFNLLVAILVEGFSAEVC